MVALLILGAGIGLVGFVVIALRKNLPLVTHTTEYECGTCGTKQAGHKEHGVFPWLGFCLAVPILLFQGLRQWYRWEHYGPPVWFTAQNLIWDPLSVAVPAAGLLGLIIGAGWFIRRGIRNDRAAKAQLHAEAFNQPHPIPRLDQREHHDPSQQAFPGGAGGFDPRAPFHPQRQGEAGAGGRGQGQPTPVDVASTPPNPWSVRP